MKYAPLIERSAEDDERQFLERGGLGPKDIYLIAKGTENPQVALKLLEDVEALRARLKAGHNLLGYELIPAVLETHIQQIIDRLNKLTQPSTMARLGDWFRKSRFGALFEDGHK